jgi:hypothetical protein
MWLKNCLQLFRAFEDMESGEVDWVTLGNVSGPSLLSYIHGQQEARQDMEKAFTPEQLEKLFPSP